MISLGGDYWLVVVINTCAIITKKTNNKKWSDTITIRAEERSYLI